MNKSLPQGSKFNTTMKRFALLHILLAFALVPLASAQRGRGGRHHNGQDAAANAASAAASHARSVARGGQGRRSFSNSGAAQARAFGRSGVSRSDISAGRGGNRAAFRNNSFRNRVRTGNAGVNSAYAAQQNSVRATARSSNRNSGVRFNNARQGNRGSGFRNGGRGAGTGNFRNGVAAGGRQRNGNFGQNRVWQGHRGGHHGNWDRRHRSRAWWRSNFSRFALFGGGYYYWNSGFWYPAYGYDPYFSTYTYDAPIYGYNDLEPGDIVASVQRELQRRGYNPGGIDGQYGPATRRALLGYQRDNGLPVTGEIDEATLESLGLQ